MPRIRLSAPDRAAAVFEASPVYSILVAAQRNGVPLRHDCGGKALCGTCRVRVLSGRLSPMGERERIRLEAAGALPEQADGANGAGKATGAGVGKPVFRLACQARPGSDLELEAVLPLDRSGQE